MMWYAMISESNITGGIAIERIEAKNIEDAWQKAEEIATKHEEVMVFPLSEGNQKVVADLLDDQVKSIILEALRDYRKWSENGVSTFADAFSESDFERIKQIDAAIKAISGQS